ncbi:MAG: cyclically-permuted mutarotase family protein [Muribaculaceae bacterium]|nr:cyclically-permuted mutarotase family protein [Muribaculaceae bacterium]
MRFRLITILTLLTLLAGGVRMSAKIKVACVGNSITYGFLVEDRENNAYPVQLQRMLGDGYEVENFGKSGATLLNRGHRPYMQQDEYKAAIEFDPDIVIIHLGVNDTDPRDWPNYRSEFVTDYLKLIDSFKARNPKVRVMVALLSPLSAKHFRFRSGTRDWRLQVQDAIANVALASGAELIDFNLPLRDRQNLLTDGIHPNAAGMTLIAGTVYGAITGNYGGLKLPDVYQSGMVMQRNRPLTINGRADAGARIALTLDGRTYHATANNRGDWTITTAPIVTGPVYTMTVTDGKQTIKLTDILAGEVWVAAGQSNMEFYLKASVGGKEQVANSADPMLRIYDMHAVDRTDNRLWTDSVCNEMDNLRHYTATKWAPIEPDNAGQFSAVAYNFARTLRDSLDVPVGIISAPVGGSPTESWIDVNTLEMNMPEVLVNWRTNDYLQPWAQQRVGENIGNRPGGRHPYEPTYLYSAAIRPIEGLPVAGAIWYQGESNAHNTYLHEQLFPLLIESWRKAFSNDTLPFYFVQLSSLNRPSWPEFRDSQRRMSLSIPHTGMAVSSDVGDSLDVHPTFKRPVGERLGRIALHDTYGYTNLVSRGPQVKSAIAMPDGTVRLIMDSAEGTLTTKDGYAPRTFEVAEIEGIYYPATAEIKGNEIILKNMDVKNPRYVRYGWQPFTRANLMNTDGLPASTFQMEVSNAADLDIEPGMEVGISAPYAGMLGGKLITAGGCNFPVDPMGPASSKKFYKGIYAADPATMQWERVGSLPEGMAYGATANAGNALILIGGTTATSALSDVKKLSAADGVLTLTELPSLPVTLDNMAACAVGRKVYAAGGNADGKPSADLYVLDLDNEAKGWKKLRRMPGNPRVQPVMAAAADARGEECLYVWGGFAGKHDGKDATLETAGLKYTPSTGKWTELPAPTDPESNALSTGGGAAVTLKDGRIAVAGGVNKDIFLAALQNQAPDYLQHPIDWYRFNPYVLVFNPATGTWTVDEKDSGCARAGAAMIADGANGFYMTGGELKPRIRTAETLHVTVK